MTPEEESRIRARVLLSALDGAVDEAMRKRGVPIPTDNNAAFEARKAFLSGLDPEVRVGSLNVRRAYRGLRGELAVIAQDPELIGTFHEKWAEEVLNALRAL